MIRNKDKPKKISLFLPSVQFGGAELLTITLANDWSKRGYEVDLIILRTSSAEEELFSLIAPSVNIVTLHSKRLLSSIIPIAFYFRKAKPDFSIAAMWPLTIICILSWLLSGRCGKLFISDHTQLSISLVHELNVNKLALRASIFIFYRFVSGIIAVSKGVRDDISFLGKLSQNKIEVIYNPASTKKLEAAIFTHDPFLDLWQDPGYKILAAGTLKEQKDFPILIKAINEISMDKKVSLIILGEGPERSKLESLIESFGLSENIALPGYTKETLPYFQSADLFVLSSAWEGFGNVLVESLECGTPIVSTDCKSGPSEILNNGEFGKLIPVGDFVAAARGIEEVLMADHNPERLRNRAELFSVERISSQYLEYFQAVK